jgi:hypothetical protein
LLIWIIEATGFVSACIPGDFRRRKRKTAGCPP